MKDRLKILVACEFSGTVRDAFADLGHVAWSVDLEPDDSGLFHGSNFDPPRAGHYQGNIFDIDHFFGPFWKWDLVIMHPPCTAIACCGNATYAGTPERERAADFIWKLWNEFDVKYKCLENPVGQIPRYLPGMPKPQYIQPYQFGHPETKKTGLWLQGLPELVGTNDVYNEMMSLPKKERHRIWYTSPSKHRGKERSRFYPGVAAAMAEQWTKHILTKG